MSSNAFNELDREYTEREDYFANRAEERRRKITYRRATCEHGIMQYHQDIQLDKAIDAARKDTK